MTRLLLASASLVAMGAAAFAQDDEVKIGIILGYTGPLESIVPAMTDGAEMAIAEVNAAGTFLGGTNVTNEQADSTCIDAAAATAAAEGLVASGVDAFMGADCSGVTSAVLTNVAVPNGIGMISPSATSPGLSTAEDGGLFFRTAPSDARQGVIITDILAERGVTEVALTFTNNDYGKGLADAFTQSFTESGGTITITAPHEDGKADYSAEVAALAASGSEVLVVAGYSDQGGRGIIQNSLDTGAFETFYLPDGMVGQELVTVIGEGLNGSFGAIPGIENEGSARFQELAAAAPEPFEGTASFAPESYDAAALILLAMQAAGSQASADWTARVLDVANAPGEPVLPGDLARGLELVAAGTDIDYLGASGVELIGPGESAGNYREVEFADGAIETVGFR